MLDLSVSALQMESYIQWPASVEKSKKEVVEEEAEIFIGYEGGWENKRNDERKNERRDKRKNDTK